MTWEEEQAQKRRVENVRVAIAFSAAVLGAVCIAIVYCVAVKKNAGSTYTHGLLAALVATTIVAGARALEGPEPAPESRRRGALPPASQLARSWLTCFIAVAAVFLLTEAITKINLQKGEAPEAQTGISVSGTLQIDRAGQTHEVEIAEKTAG